MTSSHSNARFLIGVFMFALKHISKSFDDNSVLDNVSLSVNNGEVIALIGENGTGKTTLLEIIAGKIQPDNGQVLLNSQVVGYIPQEMPLGKTIKASFSTCTEEWRIYYALNLVGLSYGSVDELVDNLSGGQKTRLAFATVLAINPIPSILLLDEPTNNLDDQGLIWLKDFIRSFSGSVLLVTHDRSFINDVSTSIVELDEGAVKVYGGDYDLYKKQKQIEKRTEIQEYEQKVAEKKHLEKVFKEVQYRAKHGLRSGKKCKDPDKAQFNWHMQTAQNTFSRQTTALKTKLARFGDLEKPQIQKDFRVNLIGEVPESKLMLQLKNVKFNYGDDVILSDVSLEIRGGERIRLVGKNGSGKTTLLKIASGQLQSKDGIVVVGKDVKVGYFSQDVNGIDTRKTVLQNFDVDMTTIRNLMHVLGISKNDVFKPIGKLSRGQQAKIGIAKLLLGQNHLLILDEPTNHLDIKTREQIEFALKSYKGAILLASHDEYFVDSLNINKSYRLENGQLANIKS